MLDEVSAPAGSTLVQQGDSGYEFMVIEQGTVDVLYDGQRIDTMGPGDFFGELALMSGNPRNANVIATRPVDTYVLGKDDFDSAIQASASFREQLRRVYFARH